MKTITRIKKGETFVLQLGQCSFINKTADENGYVIKESGHNVNIFVTDKELKIAKKEGLYNEIN